MPTHTRTARQTHVSLGTRDLERSVAFYRTLFGSEPTLVRHDYARFTLDDPALVLGLNLVAEGRDGTSPLEHLGIAFPDERGLSQASERLTTAGFALDEEPDVVCCYARLTRAWATDPDGVR